MMDDDTACKTHPDAPHGFNRTASHTQGRYVCDCEWWEPPEPEAIPPGPRRHDPQALADDIKE